MKLTDILTTCAQHQNRLVVLSGAGISAESGIPTFRGSDGYWTVGSQEYRAEEMTTFKMFQKQPDDVWEWYLYRLGVCRNAKPNVAHYAIASLEQLLRDSFLKARTAIWRAICSGYGRRHLTNNC
jgi:NAD-dependent deacetylase